MRTTEHNWTMVIDIDRCTGCQACVVACHAENNVSVVGEEEVTQGRAMHWLRIERYWEGAYPDVKARFLPVLCQQCERAPCEPVCPVFATYHSELEHLNIQVYNRCIGTRYCANNCPYIARVFNWFDPYFPEPLEQQLNPDVTVRRRGIMEKCTFCVHRVDRGVKPACVENCPMKALAFGDLDDPESDVAKILEKKKSFRLLEELGTRPRVYYVGGVPMSHGDGGGH